MPGLIERGLTEKKMGATYIRKEHSTKKEKLLNKHSVNATDV